MCAHEPFKLTTAPRSGHTAAMVMLQRKSHATEQTEVAAMTPTTEPNEHQGHAATEHVPPEPDTNAYITQEQTSLPVINSLDDIIANFGPQRGEEEACRTLHLAAQTLQNAKQDQIRQLCLQRRAHKASGVNDWMQTSNGTYKRN